MLVLMFALFVNAAFAGTGFSSDLDMIVGVIIFIFFAILGIDYLVKYISRKRKAKKHQTELLNHENGELTPTK